MSFLRAIVEKKYDLAREMINEELKQIALVKLEEMKKMVVAETGMKPFVKTLPQKRVAMDVLEDNTQEECWTGYRKEGMKKKGDRMVPNCVKMEEETLEEARINIVKARIRGGQIQRRKKVSNVPGMTLRGGKLTRMSAMERRRRKLGAKKAARKVKGKMTRILMKRKRSLQKRQRLGL